MTNLRDLKARVDAATGPDRGLDLAIAIQVDGLVREKRAGERKEWLHYPDAPDWKRIDPSPHSHGPHSLPRYTASIDSALALVERLLPGHGVLMATSPDRALADISRKPLGYVEGQAWPGHGSCRTLPLAIISALLAAKLAEGA